MTDAQLLQCPDCSHRHDLSALGAVEVFHCAGCARPLKVPAVLLAAPISQAPTPMTPMAPTPMASTPAALNNGTSKVDPTLTTPVVNPGRRAAAELDMAPVRIRLWIRLAIWCVAVPFGMFVVFGIAGKLNIITFDELLKTFTASGWDRFAPIAKILPVAALLIAIIVQASVTGLERRERKMRMALLTSTANSGSDRLETLNVR